LTFVENNNKNDLKQTAQAVHTVMSHYPKNVTKPFRRNRRLPLEYDKYFVGRSYQLFKNAIRSDKSLQLYKQHLFHFCDFLKMTTEEIVLTYGGENVKASINLQHRIEDYVILLQTKVRNKEMTAMTATVMVPPVKLFCEMNDIILNWKKINKLLPHGNDNATDEAYTREQIKKMLDYSDLRAKIPILFMASSGMRLGGFQGLTDGCVKPIYDEKSGRLLAAHVIVYKGTDDEYDTFISPEAYHAYEEYRNLRIKFGENISKNSPILLRRFDISPDGKSAAIDNTKPLALSTIAGILLTVAYKAGIREASDNYHDRYNIKIAHGFRKFFSTTVSSIKAADGSGRNSIDFIKKEWLLGHALTSVHALEENYNRSDRVTLLLEDYLKAVKELTVSDEERLQVEVKKLQTDISNMKTVEVQLAAKDKEIEDIRSRFDLMQSQIQSLLSSLSNMQDQNHVNQMAKTLYNSEILKKGDR
jgi:integrase